MMRRLLSSSRAGAPTKLNISREIRGDKSGDFFLAQTPKYRVFLLANGRKISPWHDLPLFPLSNDSRESQYLVTMVNEIPRGSTAKMEVATKEEGNPVKQDVNKKSGSLRHYPFTSLVNYGMIPQTWESPKHEFLPGVVGDNDPVDVCDVGSPLLEVGQVTVCKVLGVAGMIDEGEMDWKVIAINRDDPKSTMINTIADLERLQPGKVKRLMDWFKQYKVPDGKPLNTFAFDDDVKDADFAMKVIRQTHQHWRDVAALKSESLWVSEELEQQIQAMRRREQGDFDREFAEKALEGDRAQAVQQLIADHKLEARKADDAYNLEESRRNIEKAEREDQQRIEREIAEAKKAKKK
jgi:inorganic pyrophosphatase